MFIFFIPSQFLCGIELPEVSQDNNSGLNNDLDKIGDNPYPTNPMNDRALGYLLQGKVKNAIIMHELDVTYLESEKLLKRNNGSLRDLIEK